MAVERVIHFCHIFEIDSRFYQLKVYFCRKFCTIMDVTIKEKIDKLLSEVNAETDLNKKMEHLYYIWKQTDFCIWSLEEEQRQYENNNSY